MNKSQVLRKAHKLAKLLLQKFNDYRKALSFALRSIYTSLRSSENLSLDTALRVGKVSITFMKKSGEITTRVGTKNYSLIPRGKWSKGTRKNPEHLVAFFSLTNDDYRSANRDHVIEYKLIELCK